MMSLQNGSITVLFSNIRTYFRKLWHADTSGGCSNDVLVFQPKEVNAKFLYYVLADNNFIDYTNATSKGTKMPRGDKSAIQNYSFNLPPLREQKAIAHILGSLDDKIELNRQMNKTLEDMAQALFKSWFVNFDPVIDNALKAGNPIPDKFKKRAENRQNHQQKNPLPAEIQNLFPSEFEHHETMGWIPKGWEVAILGDITSTISKGTTPKNIDIMGKVGIVPFVKVKDIDNFGNISTSLDKIPKEIHLKQLKRSILYEGDLLFSIAGTIGRVAIVSKNLNQSNCNQAVAFIRLSNLGLHKDLVYQYLISERVQNFISANIVQAVQANASLKNISDIMILNPNANILDRFNNIVNEINKINQNNKEKTQTLNQLRDTLLPKLISGKIRVDDVEKHTAQTKKCN